MRASSMRLIRFLGAAALVAPFALTYADDIDIKVLAQGDARTKTVHYADLNLDHPSGIETLYGRIDQAASAVCGPMDERPLESAMRAESCKDGAMAEAVEHVNVPALTSYAARQSEKQADTRVAQQRP